MDRSRRDVLIALIVVVGLIILAIVFASSGNKSGSDFETSVSGSGERVGIVKILGPIYDAHEWVENIERFRKQNRVKALVVRIDSPGGAVGASQELYEAIKRARAQKPVVISMGNTAASGGYYAALGGDTIVANPGTTTGSIGVIMQTVQYHELMKTLGIGHETIKSGKFKDAGSPMRDLRPEERKYFQGYIDDAYATFAKVVSEERGLPMDKVLAVADGRVYTGTQALALGLVDVLGDEYTAIQLAAEMAGIEGEPTVVKPPKKNRLEWVELLLEESVDMLFNRLEGRGAFQYCWKPETVR